MLGGKNRKSSGLDNTLVGHKTKIVGDVHFEGGLFVEGRIEGNVQAREAGSRLSLNEHGQVEGEVRVPHVVLNGMVKGDVYVSESVELGATARVEGNVYYNMIRMEAGATVNGKLVHKGKEPVLALQHERAARNGPEEESAEAGQKTG